MKFSKLSLLCVMLGTTALTTTVMSSDDIRVATVASSSSSASQDGIARYALLDQAGAHLGKYNALVKDAKQENHGKGFADKEIAAKVMGERDEATQFIQKDNVKVNGKATKETTDWYLNFAKTVGQDFIASIVNLKLQDSLSGMVRWTTISKTFQFNTDDQTDVALANNPLNKLRFQLAVLAYCSTGGTASKIESVYNELKTTTYFSKLQDTLTGLKVFVDQLKDIELPVEFAKVEAIYADETQFGRVVNAATGIMSIDLDKLLIDRARAATKVNPQAAPAVVNAGRQVDAGKNDKGQKKNNTTPSSAGTTRTIPGLNPYPQAADPNAEKDPKGAKPAAAAKPEDQQGQPKDREGKATQADEQPELGATGTGENSTVVTATPTVPAIGVVPSGPNAAAAAAAGDAEEDPDEGNDVNPDGGTGDENEGKVAAAENGGGKNAAAKDRSQDEPAAAAEAGGGKPAAQPQPQGAPVDPNADVAGKVVAGAGAQGAAAGGAQAPGADVQGGAADAQPPVGGAAAGDQAGNAGVAEGAAGDNTTKKATAVDAAEAKLQRKEAEQKESKAAAVAMGEASGELVNDATRAKWENAWAAGQSKASWNNVLQQILEQQAKGSSAITITGAHSKSANVFLKKPEGKALLQEILQYERKAYPNDEDKDVIVKKIEETVV